MKLAKYFRIDSLKSRLSTVENLISKSVEVNIDLIKEQQQLIATIAHLSGEQIIKKSRTNPKFLSNEGIGLDQKNHF